MKYLTLSFFVLVFSIKLYAQKVNEIFVGVNGGLTYSNITTKNNLTLNTDYKKGFLGGLNLGIKLKSKFSMETCFDFYQNGYIEKYQAMFVSPEYAAKYSYFGFKNFYTQNYINNSWLVGYGFGNKIEFILQAGAYWSYLIQSKCVEKLFSYVDPSEAKEVENIIA